MPGRDRRELGAIFAGGAVGALLRVALLQTGAGSAPGWPWVTFTVNILGTFLLGYFATRLQERLPLSAYRRPLLGTGFCGAFTTFSTMQVELLTMFDARRYGLASSLLHNAEMAGLGRITVFQIPPSGDSICGRFEASVPGRGASRAHRA